ncbi:MAG: hypothetical protein KBE16_04290, partial [Alphaproteobacteria bacterium]|nr:hypothetical protein [Alphaproteobacteria bacterium]
MTFIKPTQIRQFAPLFRSFTPRIALRAMSAEVGPKVNSNTEPAPTTPLLNRSSQKTNFKDLLQNIGLLTFGAGSLAAASYFTSQKEDETLSFNRADLYPYLKPTQSPTEERLQAILKPWNKATATEEIFLLSEKILHDLHTAICQMTFAPSPIQLKEMPNPSMDGIPDALKTKMENSFKAQMTNRSNIEENLSKSYFKGPTAELDFALHVIHFKISVEYSTPYMKGEIPSGTITPQIARDIYENDGSYMLQAYYAYLNCKDRIRQNKEQGET